MLKGGCLVCKCWVKGLMNNETEFSIMVFPQSVLLAGWISFTIGDQFVSFHNACIRNVWLFVGRNSVLMITVGMWLVMLSGDIESVLMDRNARFKFIQEHNIIQSTSADWRLILWTNFDRWWPGRRLSAWAGWHIRVEKEKDREKTSSTTPSP